jgi:FkbM family methyltransferase
MLRQRLRSRFAWKPPFEGTRSYSQCGEDRIVSLVFYALGVPRPTYLDVGANEPIEFSNTYLFYRHGCRGVCVEANPVLCDKLRRTRSRDRCVNVGIGARSGGTMTLHVFEDHASGLTTFSEQQAGLQLASGQHRVVQKLDVAIVGLNDFVREHFETPPNFMSIDIEGLEVEVLEAFDFDAYGPDVICAETLRRTAAGDMEKNTELAALIESRGYVAFADTYINTIFVKAGRFPRL